MYIAFLDTKKAMSKMAHLMDLQCSVNINFKCTGKPKKHLCDLFYCAIHFIGVIWNRSCNISEECLYHPYRKSYFYLK